MALTVKLVAAASLAVAALWSTSTAPLPPAPDAPAPPALWADAQAWAEAVDDTLSLDRKIGQLVTARLTRATESQTLRLAGDGRIGAVVFPEADVDRHLRRIAQWQEAAPLPVLVSGVAVPEGAAPQLPSADVLDAAGRPDLAYLSARAVAQVAARLGVQAVPVPSPPAAATSAMTVSLVRGLRDGRVLGTVSIDGLDRDALSTLVGAGLVSAQLRVGPADSLVAIERVRALRDDLGYDGLVSAVVPRDAVALAAPLVAAGVDQVESDAPLLVGQALSAAVTAGTLDADRVDQSARRVLAAKAWSGLDALRPPTRPGADGTRGAAPVRLSPWRAPAPEVLSRARLLTLDLARQGVTVLQEPDGPVPLVGPAAPRRVLTVLLDPSLDVDHSLPFANAVSTGFDDGIEATYVRVGLGDPAEAYARATAAARRADAVVLGLYATEGRLAARHRSFVESVLRSGKTVVVAALGGPSLYAGLPRPDGLVVAYGDGAAHQQAAAEAIVGRIAVGGRLPRAVVGLYPAGAGARVRQQALRPGTALEAGLRPDAVDRVRTVLDRAVRQGAFPGASVAIGRDGVLVELDGFGRLSRNGSRVTPETAYDLASLTKVVGTTAAVMRLVEDGRLDLDDRVVDYLPDYAQMGKEAVTIRNLLEHSAGHRPFYPFYAYGILDRDDALAFVYADTLRYRPGARSRYSDFDMIVLGEIVAQVSDDDLDDHLREVIFDPLGMTDTGFRRPGEVDRTAAPTEYDRTWRGRTLQGEVHDEAASVMGGIAGHAGLFSTARDLSRFAFLLSNGGEAYGTRLFRRTTIDRFTRRVRLRSTYPTGLGWMVQDAAREHSSAGSLFGPRSFGHTGFTGTSIWVDPEQDLFLVLLSNRVHPTRRNRAIREVRGDLADAVAGAIRTPPGLAARGLGFGPVPDDLPRVARRDDRVASPSSG